MAEEKLSLHIDTDWKKQAQEEKRKLAEAQEKQKAEQAKAKAAAPAAGAGGKPGAKAAREIPPATFGSLVNSILTQAMLYLGEIVPQGSAPMLNLDMAKYQIDLMGILEEKTVNNLTPEEQHQLDSAAYDLRARFVTIASQYI